MRRRPEFGDHPFSDVDEFRKHLAEYLGEGRREEREEEKRKEEKKRKSVFFLILE